MVGRFHAIIRANPHRKLFPKRFDDYTSHQEAMVEAIAWISEIVPYHYPEYECSVIPVAPN